MPKEISPIFCAALPMIAWRAYLQEHPEERERFKRRLQMEEEIEEAKE